MSESFAGRLAQLKTQLLGPLGKLSAEVRRDIVEGRIIEEPLNAFVIRVRASASTVTQAHVDALKASGLDEDSIFDATVCAAFVAGMERWTLAMKALGRSDDAP
jgi:hypothetical protein